MGNEHQRLMTPARRAGLGLLVGAALVLGAGAAVAADKDKKPPAVSEDIAKKLRPAQEAGNKGDLDTCIAGAKDAAAESKKPYDKETSLNILAWCLGKKSDFPAYAEVQEQLNEVETRSQEDKVKSYKPLAQIYYQQKNYEKAEKYGRLWAETSNSVDAYGLLVAVYYTQQDCAKAIPAQEKANEIDKAAGKDPTEQSLRILNSCYYKTDDKTKRAAVMEELLHRFPKADYYTDLMQIYREGNMDKRALLELYRFGFDKEWISRESVFVEYVQDALDAGAPAEAAKVIDAAMAKGAFPVVAETDRNGRLKARAKQQAAEDKKMIAQLDKEARAKQNGEADVNIGLAYLSLGENDKAAEALERGLTADRVGKVKRVDDAQMMLGIAYKRLGKAEEAKKAFTAAAQDARMAKAATIWLQSL